MSSQQLTSEFDDSVTPFPLKVMRSWIKSRRYAPLGAAFAKLFVRSPSLAKHIFAAVRDEMPFLRSHNLLVEHPDFQRFLLGYRQQVERIERGSQAFDDYFMGAFFAKFQRKSHSSLDHWQQIRLLANQPSSRQWRADLCASASILSFPKIVRSKEDVQAPS